jgi:carotenoid cleavage dioxygenase-like enzyme
VTTILGRRPTDSAKVSIGQFGAQVVALAETPMQIEIDPATLKSVGVFLYEPNDIGQMTTAHPHFFDETMYNVVIRYGRISQQRVYRGAVGQDGLRAPTLLSAVPTALPSYMHSFGLSARHVILTAQPFTVNPLKLLLWMKPFIENFTWQARQPTVFHVIDRQSGRVVGRYEAEPFFTFHHVNCFEQGDELVVDVVGYDDPSIITHYYLDRLRGAALALPEGTLRRFRLPLKGGHRGRLRSEQLSAQSLEMPRIDYDRFNARGDYRTVYGISATPGRFYDQIVKVDVRSGAAQRWQADGCYPGEPVFIAAPESKSDDDGVLLSIVLDTSANNAFLLVLDAATLTEIGRATVPQALVFGFHSQFLPTTSSIGREEQS